MINKEGLLDFILENLLKWTILVKENTDKNGISDGMAIRNQILKDMQEEKIEEWINV